MEKIMSVLEAVATPALFWKEGKITHCNTACRSVGLQEGCELSLPEELTQDPDGTQVQLEVGGTEWLATAKPMDGSLFLSLQPGRGQESLGMMAAAARSLCDPLMGLLHACRTLITELEEQENEDYQQMTSAVARSYFRLLRVHNVLRDTCQLSLKQGLFVEKTDIKEFFAERAMYWTDALRDADVTLQYRGPQKAFKGYVDRHLLSCAVLHMLSNAAIYHTEGTPIVLEVTYVRGRLKIRVENQGEPMPSEVFSTVFSRYLQIPDVGDRRWGGGMGLHLVQAVARYHGGTVMVQSEESGTAVTMMLDLNTTATEVNAPRLDLTGGYDPSVVILSDVLPNETYDSRNIDM